MSLSGWRPAVVTSLSIRNFDPAFGPLWITSKACPASEVTAADKKLGLPPDPQFCDNYHAGDPGFWKRVYYWEVPKSDCGDSRGNVCKDYNDWVSAWTEIKG